MKKIIFVLCGISALFSNDKVELINTINNNLFQNNIKTQAIELQKDSLIDSFTMSDIKELQNSFEGNKVIKSQEGKDINLGIYDSNQIKILAEITLEHNKDSADLKIKYKNSNYNYYGIDAVCSNSIISFSPKQIGKSQKTIFTSCSHSWDLDETLISNWATNFERQCRNDILGQLNYNEYRCRIKQNGRCCLERDYTCNFSYLQYPMFQLVLHNDMIKLYDIKKDLLPKDQLSGEQKVLTNNDIMINTNSCLCVSEKCKENTKDDLYYNQIMQNLITDIVKNNVVLRQEITNNTLILYTVDENHQDVENKQEDNNFIIKQPIADVTIKNITNHNIKPSMQDIQIQADNKESFSNSTAYENIAKDALKEQSYLSKSIIEDNDNLKYSEAIIGLKTSNNIDIAETKQFNIPKNKKCIVQYKVKEPTKISTFRDSSLRTEATEKKDSLVTKTEIRNCSYNINNNGYTCPINQDEWVVQNINYNHNNEKTGINNENCSDKIDSGSIAKLALMSEVVKETKKDFKGDYKTTLEAANSTENIKLFKGLSAYIEDKKHLFVTQSYKCCKNNDGDKIEERFPYSIKNLDTPEKINNFCKIFQKDIQEKYKETCEEYITRARSFYNLQKIKTTDANTYCNLTYLYPKAIENQYETKAELGDFFTGIFKDLGGLLGIVGRGNNTKKCIENNMHVQIATKQIRNACYPTGYEEEKHYEKILGVKIWRSTTYKRRYCCVDSDFIRLIQEEAAKQLNKNINEVCNGITIKEFESLDLSKLDVSELLNIMGAKKSDAEYRLVDDFDAKNINFGNLDDILQTTTIITNENINYNGNYDKNRIIKSEKQENNRLYKENNLQKLKDEL